MCKFIRKVQNVLLIKILTSLFIWLFISYLVVPPQLIQAQNVFNLPNPGLVSLSPGFQPTILQGIKVFTDNPLRLNFIVKPSETHPEGKDLEVETTKLIKYFLATLTVPDDDLWVNLSPYEKDRIIPNEFGYTEMGRDLLAQDYILKQITASLIYPEKELGKQFWAKVYAKAFALYGKTDVPVNTFNKVWIVPQKAVIYENGDTAVILESHLKVMLESDYVALKENLDNRKFGLDQVKNADAQKLNDVSSQIVKDIIIPAIEKEVNEGKNFASLRQIYQSMILATWFKTNLKKSILNRVYVGQNKIAGVDVDDRTIKEKIYQKYLEAFKKGAYDFIKEEYDPATQEIIPRKYFSGGAVFSNIKGAMQTFDSASLAPGQRHQAEVSMSDAREASIELKPAQAVVQSDQTNFDQQFSNRVDNFIHDFNNQPLQVIFAQGPELTEFSSHYQEALASLGENLSLETFVLFINTMEREISKAKDIVDNYPTSERKSKLKSALNQASDRIKAIKSSESATAVEGDTSLSHMIEISRAFFNGRLNIELQVEDPRLLEGHVDMNPWQLSQVIDNLLQNAFEAHAQKVIIKIKPSDQKKYVSLEIEDNGDGVPQEIRNRIFERRFTSGKENGTGLGLDIVKGLLETYKGKIDLEESHTEQETKEKGNSGTTFLMELPLRDHAMKADEKSLGSQWELLNLKGGDDELERLNQQTNQSLRYIDVLERRNVRAARAVGILRYLNAILFNSTEVLKPEEIERFNGWINIAQKDLKYLDPDKRVTQRERINKIQEELAARGPIDMSLNRDSAMTNEDIQQEWQATLKLSDDVNRVESLIDQTIVAIDRLENLYGEKTNNYDPSKIENETVKLRTARAKGLLNVLDTLFLEAIGPKYSYMFEDWLIEAKGDVNYVGGKDKEPLLQKIRYLQDILDNQISRDAAMPAIQTRDKFWSLGETLGSNKSKYSTQGLEALNRISQNINRLRAAYGLSNDYEVIENERLTGFEVIDVLHLDRLLGFVDEFSDVLKDRKDWDSGDRGYYFNNFSKRMKAYTKDVQTFNSKQLRNGQEKEIFTSINQDLERLNNLFSSVASDAAMRAVPEVQGQTSEVRSRPQATSDERQDKYGGIDLNPAMLEMQKRGQGMDFNAPMDPAMLENINGFTPVIIQIVPITNIPLILGFENPPSVKGPELSSAK
jgi:signal transduction histidine kinase